MATLGKLKQMFSNREVNTVAHNIGYLTLLQVAGYVFPFITMPYLARVIGTNGFGKIAFASAIICWVQTVVDWGFTYTATRDVAQNREERSKVSEIFSNVLWARLLLTFMSFFVLVGCILLIPSFREDYDIILVTFLMVPGHILFPDWFFQALEKMKYTTIFNLAVKFIFTVLVFSCIREEDDYIVQPLLTSAGYLVCGAVSMWIILRRWGYCLMKPRFKDIWGTMKGSADVFLNNLMPNLYNSFSTMMLGSLAGSTASGIYDGGNKFVSVASNFHNVLSRAFFPFLSRRIDKAGMFAIINMLTGCAIALLLFAAAPLIIRIFLSSDFSESVTVLRIFAISMIFLVMSNTYGTNYLILVHRERELRNITAICSSIGMLMSYPLVSRFSYIGAALTVFISRLLLGMTTYIYARREINKHNNMNIKDLSRRGGGEIYVDYPACEIALAAISSFIHPVVSFLSTCRTERVRTGNRESEHRYNSVAVVAMA